MTVKMSNVPHKAEHKKRSRSDVNYVSLGRESHRRARNPEEARVMLAVERHIERMKMGVGRQMIVRKEQMEQAESERMGEDAEQADSIEQRIRRHRDMTNAMRRINQRFGRRRRIATHDLRDDKMGRVKCPTLHDVVDMEEQPETAHHKVVATQKAKDESSCHCVLRPNTHYMLRANTHRSELHKRRGKHVQRSRTGEDKVDETGRKRGKDRRSKDVGTYTGNVYKLDVSITKDMALAAVGRSGNMMDKNVFIIHRRRNMTSDDAEAKSPSIGVDKRKAKSSKSQSKFSKLPNLDIQNSDKRVANSVIKSHRKTSRSRSVDVKSSDKIENISTEWKRRPRKKSIPRRAFSSNVTQLEGLFSAKSQQQKPRSFSVDITSTETNNTTLTKLQDLRPNKSHQIFKNSWGVDVGTPKQRSVTEWKGQLRQIDSPRTTILNNLTKLEDRCYKLEKRYLLAYKKQMDRKFASGMVPLPNPPACRRYASF